MGNWELGIPVGADSVGAGSPISVMHIENFCKPALPQSKIHVRDYL